jgi:hypothetical protein
LGHEVEPLSGIADKDDLLRRGMDKLGQAHPRTFIGRRRQLAQPMDAAVDVGVVAAVVVVHGRDDCRRLLRRCRAIEIDERHAGVNLGGKDGKVSADAI